MIWEKLFSYGEFEILKMHKDAMGFNNSFAPLRQTLGMMRLNKALHQEITAFFYSRNKWRFTASTGWIALSCFLDTIGPANFQHIRHLTIHVPFPMDDVGLTFGPERGGLGYGWIWTFNEQKTLRDALERRGMDTTSFALRKTPHNRLLDWRITRIPPRLNIPEKAICVPGEQPDMRPHDAAFLKACRQLAAVGGLQHLELILPAEYTLDGPQDTLADSLVCPGTCVDADFVHPTDTSHCHRHHRDAFFWERLDRLRAAIPGLKLALVLHHGAWPQTGLTRLWRARLRLQAWALARAQARGYAVGHTRYQANFEYDVTYDEDVMEDALSGWRIPGQLGPGVDDEIRRFRTEDEVFARSRREIRDDGRDDTFLDTPGDAGLGAPFRRRMLLRRD
ncbi:uncharacterized protein LTHEOB_8087 [Neofusicoccum parvum]|nr:uncharacterized protein LTHEOB_8087 [Neofusicoccum parvum]